MSSQGMLHKDYRIVKPGHPLEGMGGECTRILGEWVELFINGYGYAHVHPTWLDCYFEIG